MKTPVIIDTDPGIDDAVALITSFFAPSIDIKLLCSTAGNLGIDVTTQNVLHLCELYEKNIPVAKGLPHPLRRELITTNRHGKNGLKCNYSSISRTLTHMGTNRSFSIDSILAYAYTTQNYFVRRCIIVAIPKTIKTLTSEVIDFSTPMPEPVQWKNKAYATYDKIKDPYRVDPVFNFASLEIDEQAGTFVLTTNDKHFAKIKPGEREKYLTEFREKLSKVK